MTQWADPQSQQKHTEPGTDVGIAERHGQPEMLVDDARHGVDEGSPASPVPSSGQAEDSWLATSNDADRGAGAHRQAGMFAEAEPRVQWRDRLVLDTVRALLRHWILCAVIVLLAAAAGGISTLWKPSFYVARAKIYPAASENQMGAFGLPGIAGLLGTLGVNSNTASQFHLYEQALMSRDLVLQLLDTPMERASLNGTVRDYLGVTAPSPALRDHLSIQALRSKFTYDTDPKTGVTTIGARDFNPQVAALLVNRAVELLNKFDLSTSSRQARAKREFIEGRLVEAGKTLGAAEMALERFRSENVRIGNAPHLQLEAVRLERELEIEQQVYLTLRKEAELARIEEERSVPAVNVLERAEPPVFPAGPFWKRSAVLSGFFGGLFTVAFFALRALQPRRLLSELGITQAPRRRRPAVLD